MTGAAAASQPAPSLPGNGTAGPADMRLSPLRDDLSLHPGPPTHTGAPTWTLHDPAGQRNFRIGWLEFEILLRWSLQRIDAVAQAVARETTLSITVDDVERFARFLAAHNLLRVQGDAAIERLVRQSAASRKHWALWLLKNYLFIRIPLMRPDRFLSATLPWIEWVFSRGFLVTVVLMALLGGWLAMRQWDQFVNTFLHFFSLEGLILFGVATSAAKVLHEFGHAYTARRYGCRIPTMGIAFMVLWPVLYTDASDAWKLPSRRQRLAIGVAGMAAELILAVVALLAWSFLPDGALRSAAFILATSTWILTLSVNLSPLMRFDGYYLLSDLWDIPNLQDRAFAMARWWLRECLFGLGEPVPESLPRRTRRLMIAYAAVTWTYRFFLFLGIALLVYHVAFKILGLFLMAVEVGWFLVKPVLGEIWEWARRRDRFRFNINLLVTLTVAGGLLLLLLVPWRTTVTAAALLRAERQAELFTSLPGRLEGLTAAPGTGVTVGQALAWVNSPDLDYEIRRNERSIETLRGQTALMVGDRDLLERRRVAWQELEASLAEQQALHREQADLTVAAPINGTVVDVDNTLRPGDWLAKGESVGVVVDFSRGMIEAYVGEADLGRIGIGAAGRFYPENPDLTPVDATVVAIDDASTRTLADPDLASLYGGDIPVRQGEDRALVPEMPIYRVRLVPAEGFTVPSQELRGRLMLTGERLSPALQVWRAAVGIVIRESGF